MGNFISSKVREMPGFEHNHMCNTIVVLLKTFPLILMLKYLVNVMR